MVFDDIEKAKSKIYKQKNGERNYLDDYFLKIYHMSTENLSGYLKDFNFANKAVLTTGSSCDQIFNLVNYGCFNIEHFDINPFAKYYYELKKAGILELSLKEYLSFFNNDIKGIESKVLNEKLYYRLSRLLDNDSKLFWDSLYNLFTPSEINERLFFEEKFTRKQVIINNDYLDKKQYKLLRRKIENVSVTFMTKNVKELPSLNKKYDYILLSNIFDYLFKLNVLLDEEEITESLICYTLFLQKLISLLSDEGIMFFHYLWEKEHNYLFYRINNFIADKKNISSIEFPNCKGKNNHDTVLVYKK